MKERRLSVSSVSSSVNWARSGWHVANHLLTTRRALLTLRCTTRNQIIRFSLLPLSPTCERRIVSITARSRLRRGTREEQRSRSIYTNERHKRLSFQKVYQNQQRWRSVGHTLKQFVLRLIQRRSAHTFHIGARDNYRCEVCHPLWATC